MGMVVMGMGMMIVTGLVIPQVMEMGQRRTLTRKSMRGVRRRRRRRKTMPLGPSGSLEDLQALHLLFLQ
jgi:hypothetical protein